MSNPTLSTGREGAPPTRAQWLTEVMSCLKLKKILCSLQHSSREVPGGVGTLPSLKLFQASQLFATTATCQLTTRELLS